VRFLPAAQIERIKWGRFNNWHRFAELADGTWLAINWSPEPGPFFSKRAKASPSRGREPCAICHYRPSTIGRPGSNPVVAHSFAELLDGLLKSGGRPYWLEAGFEAYGDAERYTRIA
jgi:hypothetical protein